MAAYADCVSVHRRGSRCARGGILDPTENPPRTRDFPGETFRVLKERELRRYGEYRTARLVLGRGIETQMARMAADDADTESIPSRCWLMPPSALN